MIHRYVAPFELSTAFEVDHLILATCSSCDEIAWSESRLLHLITSARDAAEFPRVSK